MCGRAFQLLGNEVRFHAGGLFDLPQPGCVALIALLLLGYGAESWGAPPWVENPHTLSIGSSTPDPRNQTSSPMIHIAWVDNANLLPRGFTILKQEVERIFGEAGIEVTWSQGPSALEDPNVANLQVLLLSKPGKTPNTDAMILGAITSGPFDRVGPPIGSIFVYVENVLRTLGIRIPCQGSFLPQHMRELVKYPMQRHRIAIALGRIVSHEAIHAIAPTIPHKDRGLMSSIFRRTSLVTPDLRMSPLTAAQFRSQFITALSR